MHGPFDFLMGRGTATYTQTSEKIEEHKDPVENETQLARDQVRQQLRDGLLEEQYIEIDVQEQPKDNNLDVAQG
ncbi:MAG: hypothetical protein IK035_03730, partial [Firmicutes bacterium]|nr:hypothetical protein [Bacillota bacterium]